jgi:hypothetical protein
MKAIEGRSQKGNDMITLTLEVFDKDGTSFVLIDYLVGTMEYKLRDFAYSIGLGQDYESGNLNDKTMIGKSGILKLGIEKGTADGKGGLWPDKNIVKDYINDGKADVTKPVLSQSDVTNEVLKDEPPF